jgi:SNF2 family DNA or RNA helicase
LDRQASGQPSLVLAAAQKQPVPALFQDLLAYERDASTKTKACVDLLAYHRDGGKNTIGIESMANLPSAKPMSTSFKGVIYTTFPSTMGPLKQALKLHKFTVCTYTGHDPKRDAVIANWNLPTGPNILIISAVGMTGINLAAANVMIQMVCPWAVYDYSL